VLVQRNHSLVAARASRFGSGVSRIVRGLDNVRYLQNNGMLDAKAAIETAHQLALAGAGVYLRIIENLYRDPRTGSPDARMEESVRNALFLSAQTLERLSSLAEVDGGLSAKRHDDNYISSVIWRVQSRVIRLRVQLAARTALLAGLCPPLTQPHALARDAALSTTLDCDIPHIQQSYLDLVRTTELTEANEVAVVQLALWLAFLNGGRIPVARDAAPALKNLRFLDLDPAEIVEGSVGWRHMDVAAASRFLIGKNANAGILSGIRQTGPVADALTVSSAQGERLKAFTQWRRDFPHLSSQYDAAKSD